MSFHSDKPCVQISPVTIKPSSFGTAEADGVNGAMIYLMVVSSVCVLLMSIALLTWCIKR